MQPGGKKSRVIDRLDVLHRSYRWLFFIEGGLTCVIALVAFYMVPNFPSTRASWLTAEEQFLAQKRMKEDLREITDDSLKSSRASGLVDALTDLTVWWLAIALASLNISQSFITFFPTIVATMGYNPSITLLLCVPPQVLNIMISFFVSKSVLCSAFVAHGSFNFFVAIRTRLENVSGTLPPLYQ